MRRTPEQEALLEELKAANQKLMLERLTAHERHARLADDEIRDFILERDKIAARLSALGAPNAMVGEGLGLRRMSTKDPKTIQAAIEHGKRFLPVEEEPEQAPATRAPGWFAWDAESGMLTVTLEPADFEPYKDAFPAPEAREAFAFRYDRDANRLVIPDDDETWANPVVQVISLDAARRSEALAFIRSRLN